jgi:hypothetical protein
VRYAGVDFPLELVRAFRDGDLVLFVGAGASVEPPSDLPRFPDLAARIAADAGIELNAYDREHLDEFLGSIAPARLDVHHRVAAIIGDVESNPNVLHDAIVRLAVCSPTPRIVTTNYDQHLSTVLASSGMTLPRYDAPALPMGDDFKGIVYLHGALRDGPEALIVTDRDFGRAYLRDAWAARFLERMFERYSVLFIGYSHSDTVIGYLARSLREQGRRYVLTDDPVGRNWDRLAIHAVAYDISDGTHGALTDALVAWAVDASADVVEHLARIRRLTTQASPLSAEEWSYLEDVVSDADRVHLFVESARGVEWLNWASTQAAFQELFDPSAPITERQQELAFWYASNYVTAEGLSGDALRVYGDSGAQLSRGAWLAIATKLFQSSPRPEWLAPWVVVILKDDASGPGGDGELLEYILQDSPWPDSKSEALLVLEALIRPIPSPSYGVTHAGIPRFSIDLRTRGGYWVRQWWESKVRPLMPEGAHDVLGVLEVQLARADRLLQSTGSTSGEFDPISYGHATFSSGSGTNMADDAISVVIDLAAECILALLAAGDEAAQWHLGDWSRSNVTILHRLVLHAWRGRTDTSATEKLVWLAACGWIFTPQLDHEVLDLIEDSLPEASQESVEQILDLLEQGEGQEDPSGFRASVQFTILSKVARLRPEIASASAPLQRMREEHPEWARWVDEPGQQPRSGFVGSVPPMPLDELHSKLTTDAMEGISELLAFRGAHFPVAEGPTWESSMGLLFEDVKAFPLDAIAILDLPAADGAQVIPTVLEALGQIALDTEIVTALLDRLESIDPVHFGPALASLLGDGISGTTNWSDFDRARNLAQAVWASLDNSESPDVGSPGLSWAIANPGGKLARFWCRVVASERNRSANGWTGMSTGLMSQLDSMIGHKSARSIAAEIVFTSQAHFFESVDPTWCEGTILPLLDWVDEARARRCWDGFLIWSTWTEDLLRAGLLDEYLEAACRASSFPDELRDQLCRRMAEVALLSVTDPEGWVDQFADAVGESLAVDWMHQVRWILSRLPAEEVERQWVRWMRSFWARRLAAGLSAVSMLISSALAGWAIFLTSSIGDGVDLAVQVPAALEEHGLMIHELKSGRVSSNPRQFARLLAHLLESTNQPWTAHGLDQLIPLIRDDADARDLRRIAIAGIRLHVPGADEWLEAS